MEVHIRKELVPEIKNLVVTLKFDNMDEFVNSAIRDKILELRKKRFVEITDKVSSGLKGNGLKEEDILSQ